MEFVEQFSLTREISYIISFGPKKHSGSTLIGQISIFFSPVLTDLVSCVEKQTWMKQKIRNSNKKLTTETKI